MKKLTLAILCILMIGALSACQKWTKELAFSEKDPESPEYTVEFDSNTSPVKK